MNVINILKALSNEKRLQIIRWLKEPDKHFSSSHCDVSKDGVCVGLIEKIRLISIHGISIFITITASWFDIH